MASNPEPQAQQTAVVAIETPNIPGELVSIGPDRMVGRRDAIKTVVGRVMREGVHYGRVPGTQGLMLYKEGSEVLLSTFQIAVEPRVTDLSTEREVKFQVECRGIHQISGAYLGSGLGACSSNEDKYRWRSARSKQEFDNTPETQRRVRYTRDGNIPQVRCSPYDNYQTVLAMAKKRAMKDLACTVLAASDVLKELAGGGARQPGQSYAGRQQQRQAPPQGASRQETRQAAPQAQAPSKPEEPALVNTDQVKTLLEEIDMAGIPENEILARYEIGRIEELEAAKFSEVMDLIRRMTP